MGELLGCLIEVTDEGRITLFHPMFEHAGPEIELEEVEEMGRAWRLEDPREERA